MKTARFAEVVEKAGQPTPYALWQPPARDAVFQKALKAHRVMTVHHETVGNARDYGTVGYNTKDKQALLFLFPKSVKRFEGQRIVGIKYDLVAKA
jgi:hypothetical protein